MTESDDSGRPQGSTTGRWEILSNVGKRGRERQWKRWSDVPIWYRTLDRFGLPTLMVLLLLYGGWRISLSALDIWQKAQQATVTVLEKLTSRIEDLSSKLDENTTQDKVRRAVERDRREGGGR